PTHGRFLLYVPHTADGEGRFDVEHIRHLLDRRDGLLNPFPLQAFGHGLDFRNQHFSCTPKITLRGEPMEQLPESAPRNVHISGDRLLSPQALHLEALLNAARHFEVQRYATLFRFSFQAPTQGLFETQVYLNGLPRLARHRFPPRAPWTNQHHGGFSGTAITTTDILKHQ